MLNKNWNYILKLYSLTKYYEKKHVNLFVIFKNIYTVINITQRRAKLAISPSINYLRRAREQCI